MSGFHKAANEVCRAAGTRLHFDQALTRMIASKP